MKLTATLAGLGVMHGDCLFVHASLKAVGLSPRQALSELYEAVGEQGTLVFPSFNFGFCEGLPYNVQTTPSERMGALSELARLDARAERSAHPIQSIVAIGSKARDLASCSGRTAFSDGSSFAAMCDFGTKIAYLGTGIVQTFFHIAEERAAVSYRFWKTFDGNITDRAVTRQARVDFFARRFDLSPVPHVDVKKLEFFLDREGLLKRDADPRIMLVDAAESVRAFERRLREDNGYFLETA